MILRGNEWRPGILRLNLRGDFDAGHNIDEPCSLIQVEVDCRSLLHFYFTWSRIIRPVR